MSDDRYLMTISLNVLNHLGLNLYSNRPAVIAEVIANAWDADATEIDVDFDVEAGTITVTDNGCGMDLAAVNDRYLTVGYQRRNGKDAEGLTPKGRKPMGRKGIGKLSLFSIANKIYVHTKSHGIAAESFLMDAEKIRKAIEGEDSSKPGQDNPQRLDSQGEVKTQQTTVKSTDAPKDRSAPALIGASQDRQSSIRGDRATAGRYYPEVIVPKGEIETHGTKIVITELKKVRLNQASMSSLRKRIARRFSILNDVEIRVNGDRVTFSDRDYFHKARFIYQYGADYAQHCRNIEEDEDGNVTGVFSHPHVFDADGTVAEDGRYRIKGWIAIAWHSNDLDGDRKADNDNLNKITIVVRGKVGQEDVLQDFRLGGMITKFMFGEIEADFLDLDDHPDIATSSRQSISEDDERYQALRKFIESELRAIWIHTNELKERAGLRHALSSNPYLKQWYDALRPPHLKKFANKIFGDIDKAGIEESQRQSAYANGVMLFEHLKMNHAMDLLEQIDTTQVDEFLQYLRDVDALEAEHYRQIVEERLAIIRKLRESVDENAKERILQEYIFDHLFLLDPGWERATQFEDMERRMEEVLKTKEKQLRLDIRYTKYRRVAAAHVIVELKRRSVTVTKTELESQVRGYMEALHGELIKSSKNRDLPIQAVCIVGKLPKGWDNERTRQMDEESLRLYGIRVMTYDELIDNAFVAYGEFVAASESKGELRELMEQIRNFNPDAPRLGTADANAN